MTSTVAGRIQTMSTRDDRDGGDTAGGRDSAEHEDRATVGENQNGRKAD